MPFLIQIDAWDPVEAAAVTLYLGSHDDERVCHLNGATWYPAIRTLPTFGYDFFGGEFGAVSTPRSSFVVQTTDWPNFGRYAFVDARVRLWHAPDFAAWAGYTLRFDGKVAADPSIKDQKATFSIGVDDKWLDQPLLSTYAGTGSAEGRAEIKGTEKPLAIGTPMGVSGVLLDPVKWIFQLSATGSVRGIDTPLERLARQFGTALADHANYAALDAATVPAGQWATCKAAGLVRMGAPPAGKLCFLMRGDNAGVDGWVKRAGAIAKRIVEISGNIAKVNEASVDALDTAAPYDLSFYWDSQLSIREAVQEVAAGVNAVAGVTLTGEFFTVPIKFNAASYTFRADDSSDVAVADVEKLANDAPWWRLALGCQPFFTVHGDGDYLAALPTVDFATQVTGTGRPDEGSTRADQLIRNGNLADIDPATSYPRNIYIGNPAHVSFQSGSAGVSLEPAKYLRMTNVAADIRMNDGIAFSVIPGSRMFVNFLSRIAAGPSGYVFVAFDEYDNSGALYGGSSGVFVTPLAANVWEDKKTEIKFQDTTATCRVRLNCGGTIGAYADIGMLRLASTERDANVPIQVSIVGGQDKKIAADYLGAVTGSYPVFAPSVLRNGVSIKTDSAVTYAVTKISDGSAEADGGTISLDSTAGSSTKGNVTPSAFDAGSIVIKWQLETKVNGGVADKTVCSLTKDRANPPASGGGGGSGSPSMPADATISSNTTYASLSSSAAKKITLTAGQSLKVTLVCGYTAVSSTGTRALTAKGRYANNSGMTSPTDTGSPVTGTNAKPAVTLANEWYDEVRGSLIFSQTVATPGAGDWWVDMQGITTQNGKSLSLDGTSIIIEAV